MAFPPMPSFAPEHFVTARLAQEFGVPVALDQLPYGLARRTDAEATAILNAEPGVEVAERRDGALRALFPDKWHLAAVERRHSDLLLAPLVAGTG